MAEGNSREDSLKFLDGIPLTPLSRDKGVTGFIYTDAEMECLAFALSLVRTVCEHHLPRIWNHYGPTLQKLMEDLKGAME